MIFSLPFWFSPPSRFSGGVSGYRGPVCGLELNHDTGGGCSLTPVRKPELVTPEESCLCWLPWLATNSDLSRSNAASGSPVVIVCRCLTGVQWPLLSHQESGERDISAGLFVWSVHFRYSIFLFTLFFTGKAPVQVTRPFSLGALQTITKT